MRVLCPAKINLHLRVGPRREDGFHSLLSWMVTVGLFDKLKLERTRGADSRASGSDITLCCDQPGLPVNQDNLVLKAARLIQQERSRRLEGSASTVQGMTIALDKRIPVGAGLGGGSSDAARTLLACNQLWQLNLPLERLHVLASQLGSDVPFFLHEPSAICTGRGEHVRPIEAPRPGSVLLLFPPYGLSTPAVYREFDRLRLGDARAIDDADFTPTADREPSDLSAIAGPASTSSKPLWQPWSSLDASKLLGRLVNDLEPAAFSVQPELGQLRGDLEQHLGRVVRMSGSGSSLFTIYDDATAASGDAGRVQGAFPAVTAHAVELCPQLRDDLSASVGF